ADGEDMVDRVIMDIKVHQNQDTVFISGLPDDINDEQLASHYGSIGMIKIDKKTGKPKIWIYRDKATGKGKGEATLTYEDPEA
ncbi:unnamed protein product, partial [Oppiella nova]